MRKKSDVRGEKKEEMGERRGKNLQKKLPARRSFNYIRRVDANVEAQSKRHAHRFHLGKMRKVRKERGGGGLRRGRIRREHGQQGGRNEKTRR